ncbi:MAG: ChaN family lipoprotein [Desulfobacter sp.]|nr:ChaN family lipoprotein [Desulfobacter sp.]
MRFFLIILILIPLVSACATAPKTIMRNDPLIGKIVNSSTQKLVDFTSLMAALEPYDVIYISEKHDNPMHHDIQHRIIQHLVDRGKSPTIGFEFFSVYDTPLLLNLGDAQKAGHQLKSDTALETKMRKNLGWANQSDRMWAYYWNLLSLAGENNLQATGLDISSAQKRRITRKGLAGLTRIEQKRLFSTKLDDPAYEAHMKSIFKAVHCGMNHGKMTERLYDTWTARNDQMALSIVELHESGRNRKPSGPVVVIMGNGHTEYGLGVIDRVRHLAPGISQVNLAMTEISRKPAVLDEYLDPLELEGFAPVPPADFLWFTQRVSYEDPCEKFKAALKKMKGLPPAKSQE